MLNMNKTCGMALSLNESLNESMSNKTHYFKVCKPFNLNKLMHVKRLTFLR